jgi:hypothetical protein
LVYSLERNWAFVRAIGSKGEGAGQFDQPYGMCVYRDRLIVCDYGNDRLQFIDISAVDAKDWKFDAPFGSRGKAKGQFTDPADVCAAGDVLFVAEYDADRVQSFTLAVSKPSGALTLAHRSFIGANELRSPVSLASTPSGQYVFVGDDDRIHAITVDSGDVRPFAELKAAVQMVVEGGRLYAGSRGSLYHITQETNGDTHSTEAEKLCSWDSLAGIAVLPDFSIAANPQGRCLHVNSFHQLFALLKLPDERF